MREVETVCPRDCPDSCFITVQVEEGRIRSTKGSKANPFTAGFTCPRGIGDPTRVYSKDRVLYPQIREDKRGPLKRVSWGEALDEVSRKLKIALREHGPQSVLLLDYAGNTGLIASQFTQRLWYAIGATRTDHAVCSASGHAGIGLHYGLSYGVQPEELPEKKLITFWGFNARVSSPHQWSLALKARKENGAVIAVVDPRRSETAEAADIWLHPRPGSDVALAYGVARYLIEEDKVDAGFLEEWAHDYEEYREEALRWTPQRVEEATGLSWDRVEALGEAMGSLKPGALMIGIGLNKSRFGAESVRAVSLLPSLLGGHRGFYYSNSLGRLIDFPHLTGEALTDKEHRVVSQVAIGERLERGEFRFVYVFGANPALTLPASGAIGSGLTRDDVYVVVNDTHYTETTEHADAVLPAPTYLEKRDFVVSDCHPYTRLSEKAIEPLGESRDEVWVMRELAKGLGLRKEWLYVDPWETVGTALEDAFTGGSYKDLLQGSILRLRSRRVDEYQTPTGKIEFHSTTAGNAGANPLPVQLPLYVDEVEFILLTSATPKYTHSQFRDVYGMIPRTVWVNTDDAKENGISEGATVRLHNMRGELEVRAIVTTRVPRGVVWSPRPIRDERGNHQNTLVASTAQPIGGGPTFNSTLVKIKTLDPSI